MEEPTPPRRSRRGGSLLALAAVGILLAGCTGGPGTTGSEDDGGTAVASDGGGSDGAAASDGGADEPLEDDLDDEEGPEASDGGGGAGTEAGGRDDDTRLPEEWAGTVSAETLPEGERHLAAQHLYGDQQQATELPGRDIAAAEYFAGRDAECEGTASLGGDTATCSFTDGDQELQAVAHLVPAAFGSSMILLSVDPAGPTAAQIPADTPLGFSRVEASAPEDVTEEGIEKGAMNAVMLGMTHEHDDAEGPEISCTLTDGGAHAACEVSATPDGGGDGTWYATAQPGPSTGQDDGMWYLFSQMPA